MTVWSTLTDIQADAVHATAVLHLRDPEEMVLELAPLLGDRVGEKEPGLPENAPAPPAYVLEDNVVAEPVWTLLGTTENGSGLYVRPVRPSENPVNDPLTDLTMTGVIL